MTASAVDRSEATGWAQRVVRRFRMNGREALLLVLSLLLAYLGFAGCRSLYPDDGGAREAVEDALTAAMTIESVQVRECGLAPYGCSIVYQLESNPADYETNARELRQSFMRRGWSEVRFAATRDVAGGSFVRDGVYVTFALLSTAPGSRCAADGEPIGGYCWNGMYVGVPRRGVRMFGMKVW